MRTGTPPFPTRTWAWTASVSIRSAVMGLTHVLPPAVPWDTWAGPRQGRGQDASRGRGSAGRDGGAGGGSHSGSGGRSGRNSGGPSVRVVPTESRMLWKPHTNSAKEKDVEKNIRRTP